MRVDIAQDQVNIGLVAQDDVIEGFQAELGELDRPAAHLLDFLALFFGDALGQAAGDGGAGMDLAPADHLDHGVAVLAHLDDLAADFQPDLVDDAQDVALGNRGIRPHDEVRAAQGIEMGGVVGAVEGASRAVRAAFLPVAGTPHDRPRPRPWRPPCGGLPGRRRRCGWSAGAFPPPGGRRRSARNRAVPGSGSRYWRHRLRSFRKISILPWPSSRVMGSIVIRCACYTLSFLARICWHAAASRPG